MVYEETNTIELKEELTDEVKEEISAFLNSKGGIICVGVSKDGKKLYPFSNQRDRDEASLKVANWLRDVFFPIPSCLVEHDFNEDNILIIRVSEGPNKPYYIREKGPKPSGTFVRLGTSKRKATEFEILSMIMDSSGYRYESDVSEEQNLTFRFFDQMMEEHELPFDKRTKINLGIMSADGTFSNLGLLMSDQCPIQVKVAEYDEAMNFRLKKIFEY